MVVREMSEVFGRVVLSTRKGATKWLLLDNCYQH